MVVSVSASRLFIPRYMASPISHPREATSLPMNPVHRLPVNRLIGMADLTQEAWLKKQVLQNRITEVCGLHGYRCIETPILEHTELFLRKSGGQLASQLYSFTDAGSNPVSLRPEFTSPIMRHYLECSAEIELPVRWQYAGPVFRYEDGGGASGQFTQIGAELLGSSSIMADAELFGLAALIPMHLGLGAYTLELADLDLMNSVLGTANISERARALIITSLPQFRGVETPAASIQAVLDEARKIGLTSSGGPHDYLSRGIIGLDDTQAKQVLQGLLNWNSSGELGNSNAQLGQRSPDDVVERMLRKVRGSDTEENLRRALELAVRLASIRGEPGLAIEAARLVVKESGAEPTALNRLEQFLELVLDDPSVGGHLAINLGMLRGLAYYNGIVFEVRHENWPTVLGGGGRYDALASALGSRDSVPALGFAYNMDALLRLTDRDSGIDEPEGKTIVALVTGNGSTNNSAALRTVHEMRRNGETVELDVSGLDLEACMAYARSKGILRVVVVGPNGNLIEHSVTSGKSS